MAFSPKHACEKTPVSSSSKPNLTKIWGVEKNLKQNRATWEIKRNLAERRMMDLDDLQNKNADAGNVVLATVCYEAKPIASFDPDDFVGTSTSAMARALKVQKMGLPKHFCDFHLPKQDDTIVLVDEDEQEYNTRYLVNKNGLSGGWRGFSIAHKLLEGDVLIFQVVEPRKLKVYIVRASSLTEVDGARGHLKSETQINPVKTVHQPEDNSNGRAKIAKRKYLEIIEVDDKNIILPFHSVIVADRSGKIHNDLGSEDGKHIRFSQTNIKFKDLKVFRRFQHPCEWCISQLRSTCTS